MSTHRPPLHPGEILLEEFIKPYGLTQTELAQRLGVSRQTLSAILHGKSSIQLSLAFRLSRLFGTSPELWLNGQLQWDIWQALHSGEARKFWKEIKPLAGVKDVGRI
jgi:addiction module HigA family antidote